MTTRTHLRKRAPRKQTPGFPVVAFAFMVAVLAVVVWMVLNGPH